MASENYFWLIIGAEGLFITVVITVVVAERLFSQASVILSTEGGMGVCGMGTYMVVGHVAGETATAADGMHPTGMHSCF